MNLSKLYEKYNVPVTAATLLKRYEYIAKMQFLATRSGFIAEYYRELRKYINGEAAFNAVNDRYLYMFGRYKYATYQEFIKQLPDEKININVSVKMSDLIKIAGILDLKML